jgi:hypothetical protein
MPRPPSGRGISISGVAQIGRLAMAPPPIVRILRTVEFVAYQADGDENGCGTGDQEPELPARNGGCDTDHDAEGQCPASAPPHEASMPMQPPASLNLQNGHTAPEKLGEAV